MEALWLRAVAHDERLTVTEHLGELRARLLPDALARSADALTRLAQGERVGPA
jgi:hypothetical protein